MKRFTALSTALAALFLGVSAAQATIVFQDNFDGYADQTAFTTAWPGIGCQGQGAPCTLNATSTVSNDLNTADFASDPLHLTTVLNHSPVGSPGTADSAERNQRTFPQSPVLAIGDQLAFSFDFYDISPALAPYRQFINLQSSTAVGTVPAGQLVSMGLNNNQSTSNSGGSFYMARILGYANTAVDPDGGPDESLVATNYFKMNDFSTGVGTGPGARGTVAGWHNLKVTISTTDNTNTDYNFYVDNVLSEHVKQAGAPQQYSVLRMGAGVSATEDAYFDNLKIEYIPFVPTGSADFNGDHVIDAQDYAIWRKNNPIASGATQATGDANGDGKNDGLDYLAWRGTYGNPAGGGLTGNNVPEPATLFLAMLAMAWGACVRRR